MYSTFPTLAERKSATFGAKDLSCRETSARIFSHLHALLTHLPLVSSFRRSFSSSASNAFSRQLLSKKLSSLRTKKETSRSRLIASYNAAWQRPTLAERKSATFGAKDLSCRETSARIFSHLHALLTHLPLVSSFRRSFSSSASNAFSRQLFYVEVKLFAHKKKTLLGL